MTVTSLQVLCIRSSAFAYSTISYLLFDKNSTTVVYYVSLSSEKNTINIQRYLCKRHEYERICQEIVEIKKMSIVAVRFGLRNGLVFKPKIYIKCST